MADTEQPIEDSNKYDPIFDKMSLINDWTGKHAIVERFVTVAVVLLHIVSTLLYFFPTVNTAGIFYAPPIEIYNGLTAFTLTVIGFHYFGIKFFQMFADTAVKLYTLYKGK